MDARKGQHFDFEPVAIVRSPFEEKFGIPRQPGLTPGAIGEVHLLPPYDVPGMLQGLDRFSHLWLTFLFDRCVDQGWKPRVRPPRLGGNREVGVWASRSPFRPNFIGLSAVRLIEVVETPAPLLRVAGIDLLDGTPVLDIKPYLPYADAIPDAVGGFAPSAPARLAVRFSEQAESDLGTMPDSVAFRALVSEMLSLDPRPGYRQGAVDDRTYGVLLFGRNVRWHVAAEGVEVLGIDSGRGG